MAMSNKSASDRVTNEGGDGDCRKLDSNAETDFLDIGDLDNHGRKKRDKGTGTETVQGRKDNQGCIPLCRKPKSQYNDAGEETHDDLGVIVAKTVADPAGENSTKETVRKRTGVNRKNEKGEEYGRTGC